MSTVQCKRREGHGTDRGVDSLTTARRGDRTPRPTGAPCTRTRWMNTCTRTPRKVVMAGLRYAVSGGGDGPASGAPRDVDGAGGVEVVRGLMRRARRRRSGAAGRRGWRAGTGEPCGAAAARPRAHLYRPRLRRELIIDRGPICIE